ncbi:MAG: hypothetical protein IJ663_05690 [Spirochaetales bacterium]|nr:hypothetical protein [Spirochaetales bacterium]
MKKVVYRVNNCLSSRVKRKLILFLLQMIVVFSLFSTTATVQFEYWIKKEYASPSRQLTALEMLPRWQSLS